ncbi:hypothetical protein [Pseudomonas syringae group genomosp. 3]|nr:hypothetical protein [Pseudomonas syringae group genomosp. 3]
MATLNGHTTRKNLRITDFSREQKQVDGRWAMASARALEIIG